FRASRVALTSWDSAETLIAPGERYAATTLLFSLTRTAFSLTRTAFEERHFPREMSARERRSHGASRPYRVRRAITPSSAPSCASDLDPRRCDIRDDRPRAAGRCTKRRGLLSRQANPHGGRVRCRRRLRCLCAARCQAHGAVHSRRAELPGAEHARRG